MKKIMMAACLLFLALTAMAVERKIKVTQRYLNFPIAQNVERQKMRITEEKNELCNFVVRLTEGQPQYWVFQDVSPWKGRTITLHYEGNVAALNSIIMADSIVGGSQIYKEQERPKYHYTPRCGWMNDPNGLIYYNGQYHMFYQYNPYERDWENMHWGHAVSTDMVHWQEWPEALHPDSIGTAFSGTAVVDWQNTSRFAKRTKEPALVAIYTADHPASERQCLAYSTDGGYTFSKYTHNPIIDSSKRWQSHDTRDPKVFWYAPTSQWVMVLHERDGHSIYTSPNLKQWTYESHIPGFWECPELFELPVEGTNQRLWVMWGASGTYVLGHFDGHQFKPISNKQLNMIGSGYAAQTFNSMPADDNRVVKMTWGRIRFDNTSFNGVMLLPQEQVLKQTSQGIKLFSRPVKEVKQLCKPIFTAQEKMSVEKANELLRPYAEKKQLRIKATLRLTYATDAGLEYQGDRLVTYDTNSNMLNGQFYTPDNPTPMTITLDVYIDNSIIEGFIDDGALSFSKKHHTSNHNGYSFFGKETIIEKLEIYDVSL